MVLWNLSELSSDHKFVVPSGSSLGLFSGEYGSYGVVSSLGGAATKEKLILVDLSEIEKRQGIESLHLLWALESYLCCPVIRREIEEENQYGKVK